MHIVGEFAGYQETNENSLFRKSFPNTSTVAYMDPTSQTIHLNHVNGEHFIDDINEKRFINLRESLGTIFHEVTHWADLLSTIWGRQLLNKIYSAMRILPNMNKGGYEQEFYRLIELYDSLRRLMHNEYYRTVANDPAEHNAKKPWGIQFSVGREFDLHGRLDENRPIAFTNFLDNPSGQVVARQPIVPGALMEVSAVWSEIFTNLETLSLIEDEGERLVERNRFVTERLEYLYNHDLTLYTAPAHLLAHYTKVSDVILGYESAASLAHIVLNFSNVDFESMRLPEAFKPWEGSFDAFKANNDVGFAYKLVAAHSEPLKEGQPISDWLNATLEKAGLSDAEKILSEAVHSLSNDKITEKDEFLVQEQMYMSELGLEIAESRKAGKPQFSMSVIESNELVTPPLFDRDGRMLSIGTKQFDLSKFDPVKVHSLGASLHTHITNLKSACR